MDADDSQWNWTTLKEIGTWTGGGTPSKRKPHYWENGAIPWVSPKDMKRSEISDTQDHVTERAVQDSSAKQIPAESILFVTRSGILKHTLPTAIAKIDVTINQDLKALTPNEKVDPQFLLYYTQAENSSILRECSKHGTTVASLESSKLYSYPIPVPPLPEQRRIVEKIEELFSQLDAGIAALETAKKQLRRYRQSVLQAAVEGRLTQTWRKQQDHLEPADKLLERILQERRKQWEKDYRAKYQAKGKKPPSGWKKRYKKPEPLDTSDLPELPEGWVWTCLDQLLSNLRNGYSKAPKAEDGVPILRISAVRPLSVNLDDVRYLAGSPEDYEKYLIDTGYLLFIRYNGNPNLVGVCGAVKSLDREYAHPDKLIRGEIANTDVAKPTFLEMALNTCWSREHIANRVRTTAGQAGISQGDLYGAPVPVPPSHEQEQIISEAERLLSVAEDASRTVRHELKRAERLRQSILKQAFSGKLVTPTANGKATDEVAKQVQEAEAAAQDATDQLEMEL